MPAAALARTAPVDARTDIFSFGALLHEMLSGRAPFGRPSLAETMSAILTEPPPPVAIDDVAAQPEVQRVIDHCLVKDPQGRTQSMRNVVGDLRAIRDALASGARTQVTQALAPRRSVTRTMLGAAAVVAIVAALGAWLYVRRGPSAAAVAIGQSGRPALVVLPFENVSGVSENGWLAKGLPSMLVTGLAQTPDIEVVSTDRLGNAAVQLGFATLDKVERSQLAKIAARAGAKVSLSGSFVQAGGQVRIDARIEDVASGRVLFADSVRGQDVMALADEIAGKIRRGLDVRSTGVIRPVSAMTSSSVQAYRLYSEGNEAAANVRSADAITLLEQAISLDPNFAAAHVRLARVLGRVGRLDEAEAHMSRAVELVDRLEDKDKSYVLATKALWDGRRPEAATICEQVIAKYPDTEWAYGSLASATTQDVIWSSRDAPKHLAVYTRAVEALPASAEIRKAYGYSLLWNGRYDDAIHEFKHTWRCGPRSPVRSTASATHICRRARQRKPSRRTDARLPRVSWDRTSGEPGRWPLWADTTRCWTLSSRRVPCGCSLRLAPDAIAMR